MSLQCLRQLGPHGVGLKPPETPARAASSESAVSPPKAMEGSGGSGKSRGGQLVGQLDPAFSSPRSTTMASEATFTSPAVPMSISMSLTPLWGNSDSL